ncbi:MAG: hypothetical protein IJM19_04560 [Ruminococcus sp.]|nr:hypothetical protein [Ruminococcus sp.]MBR6385424.1 hypothetical protein [Ruminococcus sp.]
MKRLITFMTSLTLAVCSVSCSMPATGGNSARENGLSCSFGSPVELTLDDMNAEGEIRRMGDGEWVVEFSSPNTLSGVELSFSEGNVTANYKGLNFSVPKSALPVKAMILNLIEAVDSNARLDKLNGSENQGMLEITGTLEGGDYVLRVDGEGYISEFEMPNNKLKMVFTDVKTITVPSVTENSQTANTQALQEVTAE